ncbi:hypothetical protein PAAG_00156 [Paracoccidioides lutzii Pb01]|uniref:Uncharacterized protein n=1 Tax=Paracoccidioides lutzii (strain ATCC MYA-826 / Pb01) TaxID=502779 RepID=C1GNR1_PARBA|nr:hypothetical protein PAAG_00156 [Paracoccidioides lutzii Pb01]EEH35833.1 hypothetical protein PAAG_00156 [Paracoccidioides lutzii Pb01]
MIDMGLPDAGITSYSISTTWVSTAGPGIWYICDTGPPVRISQRGAANTRCAARVLIPNPISSVDVEGGWTMGSSLSQRCKERRDQLRSCDAQAGSNSLSQRLGRNGLSALGTPSYRVKSVATGDIIRGTCLDTIPDKYAYTWTLHPASTPPSILRPPPSILPSAGVDTSSAHERCTRTGMESSVLESTDTEIRNKAIIQNTYARSSCSPLRQPPVLRQSPISQISPFLSPAVGSLCWLGSFPFGYG